MTIHNNFPGGNITVEKIDGDTVFIERELRDTEGDWFHWTFCVEGAAGKTLTFRFPSYARVGRFGPAVSHDYETWHWQNIPSDGSTFTYTFAEDENKVYFSHNMLYRPERFIRFCEAHGLTPEVFAHSVKGYDLPALRFGTGDTWILLTARHHACESTGSYVLEGVTETLLKALPADLSVLVVPFVDFDGVTDGDQGKNRKPHDHNRDYTDAPIYEAVSRLMQFEREHPVAYTFDFHSPWHQGEQNDHVFLSRSTEAMEANTNRFAEHFKAESAGLPVRYNKTHDVGPNEMWNNETSPNSKNYFAKRPNVDLTVTLETPYFGLADSRISIPAMLDLGHAFARAILDYIRD